MPRHTMPIELKRLNGNRGKQNLDAMEKRMPVFPVAKNQCPKHLDAIAKKTWKRYFQLLIKSNVLKETDMEIFEAFCVIASICEQSIQSINKDGLFLKDKNGDAYKNPAEFTYRNYSQLLLKYACELGLTPSSRSRLHVNKLENTSKQASLESFFMSE